MGGSSSRTVTDTDQTTNNEYNTIGQEVSDGIGILGDGNSVVMTDHGAMDMGLEAFNRAVGLTTTSQNLVADAVNDTLRTTEANTAEAFSFGRDSIGAVERIAAEAQVGAMDAAQMVKETSEQQSENAINAALTGAGMGLDTANNALLSAENIASESGQNVLDAARMSDATVNNSLETGVNAALTGAGMGLDVASGTMRDALAAYESQATMYGENINSMANQVADISAASLQAQNELAGQSLANYQALSETAMSYADSQNRYLADTLGENSLMTQTTLLEMAEMQERSLDSALQVAGAVAMDDNAEVQESQVKYLAIAMAVGMAAFALRG